MDDKELQNIIKSIGFADIMAMSNCKKRWDSLAKPRNSLGKLERVIISLAGIQRQITPAIHNRTILCFAADHGVVSEGVSPSSQIVTSQMARNFLNGRAAISVLAKSSGCRLKVFDVGMIHPVDHPGIIHASIARGSGNMRHERAMTRDQLFQALGIGFEAAGDEIRSGANLLLAGEMGVGNTTSASAIYAAASGISPLEITGTGAGLPRELLQNKIQVIQDSLALHKPDPADPEDILSAVGGFELAAMCGVMLAGAVYRCPVVVDGFISGASAIMAMLFHSQLKDFLIFSHQSGESGFSKICRHFDIVPLVDLDMRLGEGTGAAMILPLLDQALACYSQMATFAEAGVRELEV